MQHKDHIWLFNDCFFNLFQINTYAGYIIRLFQSVFPLISPPETWWCFFSIWYICFYLRWFGMCCFFKLQKLTPDEMNELQRLDKLKRTNTLEYSIKNKLKQFLDEYKYIINNLTHSYEKFKKSVLQVFIVWFLLLVYNIDICFVLIKFSRTK